MSGGELSSFEQLGVRFLESPTVSENDPKIYKNFILGNGLRVLVVQDTTPKPYSDDSNDGDNSGDSCAEEESESSESTEDSSSSGDGDDHSESDAEYEEGDEKLAACALLVNVGSLSEPEKFPGLAHFLEHMIFMGSEKYPKENAFDSHIKKCGGFDNAHTEFDETTYYFEVADEHLDSSLDVFSELFKKPLLLKDAMTRERESLDSEFQQCLHDDESRRDQVLATLATEGYPHVVFSWGNSKSLKESTNDDELNEALSEFRKEHYSGHRMVLCLQARLPIDYLVNLAVKYFGDVPSNSLHGKDFSRFNYRDAFKPEFYDEVFFVKPVNNISKLDLAWVWPPINKLYKSKPEQFISFYFGHEGEGGLCAYLRKRLWALDLIAGVDDGGFDSNTIYSIFNICIFLTPSGFEHLDEVLAATFAYVKLVADSASIPALEKGYEELEIIEQNNFRFASQRPAYDNVQSLVLSTKLYPPKDILTGSELYFEFDKDLVLELLNILNTFHFNIMVTSQQKYDGIVYNKQEKWFGTEYTSIKMPDRWRQLWDESKPMKELFLPKPNSFIANDFRIFWRENGCPEIASVPRRIMQTDVCELWFRQDDKFNLPDSMMYFSFISPLLRQSVENNTLCSLYSHLIKFRLSEDLYPATVAGMDYQIYAAERGIVVKINGFNQKQPLLVNVIIKAIVTLADCIGEDELNAFIENQKRSYFNALIKPKSLNKDLRLSITESKRWPMIEKYKCLKDINVEKMLKFAKNFTKELYIQALMQGNLTEETAHNVMNLVLTTLDCQKINETKYIENRVVQLPQGARYVRCPALNHQDANTFICNFYQIGPNSIRLASILDLLMMFIEEPLFDTLRTKEQLGYYVGADVRVNYGIAGYTISVNSQETKFNSDYVQERIEAFRGSMLAVLTNMEESDFDQVRNSLIKMKQVVDMALGEEVNRNWEEIVSEEYVFDRRKLEVNVLRQLTKQDLIDFCVGNENTNLRKLSVQIVGHKTEAKSPNNSNNDEGADEEELFSALADKLELEFIAREGDPTTITDINAFKENLFVFPTTRMRQEDQLIHPEPEVQHIVEPNAAQIN